MNRSQTEHVLTNLDINCTECLCVCLLALTLMFLSMTVKCVICCTKLCGSQSNSILDKAGGLSPGCCLHGSSWQTFQGRTDQGVPNHQVWIPSFNFVSVFYSVFGLCSIPFWTLKLTQEHWSTSHSFAFCLPRSAFFSPLSTRCNTSSYLCTQ